jgi:coenzyme F420-dependent glucose-6-phosphate dehydrogenase
MITISHPYETLKQVVDAFRVGGGEGKPIYLKVQLSYAKDKETALREAYEQWRTNIFKSPLLTDLRSPQQFDYAAEYVKPDDMYEFVKISSDSQQHINWLQEYIELGFDNISLHNVNKQQRQFIEIFGKKILPALV